MEKDTPAAGPKEIKEPKKEVRERTEEELAEQVIGEWYEGKKEKEEFLTEREKIIKEKLREELAKMELSPELEEEVQEKAKQIEKFDEKGKVNRLLSLAEEKGLGFAVGVAKGMDDPYTLDILHDILARDELYKRYSK